MRFIVCFLLLGLPLVAQAGQPPSGASGVVLDASGAPIAGATVTSETASVTTTADGTFELSLPAAGGRALQVSARGIVTATVPVDGSTRRQRILLQTAPIEDQVLVTASRGVDRLSTAGSMTVVPSAELLNSGAGSLDDALRNTPGFSLFRRSSSRVSNPTTQG